jgi:hypothetical protein
MRLFKTMPRGLADPVDAGHASLPGAVADCQTSATRDLSSAWFDRGRIRDVSTSPILCSGATGGIVLLSGLANPNGIGDTNGCPDSESAAPLLCREVAETVLPLQGANFPQICGRLPLLSSTDID